MASLKKNAPCFCGRACVYHLIRCDVCHRGVHFMCIGISLAEAEKMNVYVCRACQSTAQEENVVEQLQAEGRPGAVVFTTVCHRHNKDTGHRRSKSTSALVHHGESLSKALCDVCEHRCNFEFIQCDECEAWCHYACAKMTSELAARIDQWYCRRCLKKHPGLEITYAQDIETRMLPKDQSTKGGHSGARQLKRHAEASENGHLKKTRLDAEPFSRDVDPALELNIEDALEMKRDEETDLELYLSDDSELELDLENDNAPELKRADDHLLAMDLKAGSEDEDVLEYDLEDEPWSWT